MTSISVGLLIKSMLEASAEVQALTNKVFPVVAEDGAVLPYICYRRSAIDTTVVKTGPGADSVNVDVYCYASTYSESIALAEAVRGVLDGAQGKVTETVNNAEVVRLTARSIRLLDSEESWADDAYVQAMAFNIKIN